MPIWTIEQQRLEWLPRERGVPRRSGRSTSSDLEALPREEPAGLIDRAAGAHV
jgi:hypothetical protein